jgi:hypothetical protein
VRVREGEVVAGGAVRVGAKLQAHLNAYEALGRVQQLPFVNAGVVSER